MVEAEGNPTTWKFTQYVDSHFPMLPRTGNFLQDTTRVCVVWKVLWEAVAGQYVTDHPRCFGDKGDVEDITEGVFNLQ